MDPEERRRKAMVRYGNTNAFVEGCFPLLFIIFFVIVALVCAWVLIFG